MLSTYLESEVMSASPGKLVVMMYDGAINFLRRLDHIDWARDFEAKSYNINKAYAILSELILTLNMDHKEISDPLRGLYVFMQGRLLTATVQNDKSAVKEVLELLTGLKESWATILKEQNSTSSIQLTNSPASQDENGSEESTFSLAC